MIIRTTKVADTVLAIVKSLMSELEENGKKIDLYLEPYKNARENGWALFDRSGEKKVAFSENCNSDDIVVYSGLSLEFASGGNAPSDHAYNNARYFRYDDIYGAANFIVNFFDKEIS